MAQSGHSDTFNQCLLLGVKRTLIGSAPMSAFDPKRTSTEEWAVVPGTVDQRSEGLAQAIYRDTS